MNIKEERDKEKKDKRRQKKKRKKERTEDGGINREKGVRKKERK